MLHTTACCPGLILPLGLQRGPQDWSGLGLHGSGDLLSATAGRNSERKQGSSGSESSLAPGASIGSGESRVTPASRGTWAAPPGDLWGPVPGLLTYRGVLWEAEQGHVSVSAADPVVEEVGGEVGLG